MERDTSDGESDWIPAEVDRNHENVECTHQTPPDQPNYARDEHGNDEGTSRLRKMAHVYELRLTGLTGGDIRRDVGGHFRYRGR